MNTRGVVRFWSEEEGWGVIDSEATPGGCWAHFSAIAMEGYRTLTAGQVVEFDWELGDQDGYPCSALEIRTTTPD